VIRVAPWFLLGCLAALTRGQELLWEVHSVSGVRHGGVYPEFGDYDGDGADDLLVMGTDYRGPYPLYIVRVFSGTTGALLDEMLHPYGFGGIGPIGDFDRDGIPDVMFGSGAGFGEVWSLARRTALVRIFPLAPSGPYGTRAVSADCNGDGLPDIVGGDATGPIVVYDHSGAVLYSIPAVAMGFIPVDIAVVGDLNGDGCDDFIVGAFEYVTGYGLGAVVLISGKTGTPLRIHWGQQPYDFLSEKVRAAGDVDGDGVMDYAAGNGNAPYRHLVMVWSGATGSLLRQWSSPVTELTGLILSDMDIDLDARPDVLSVVPAYLNPSGLRGRVRTLSSRDGQDLVRFESQQYTASWGQTYATLGVQPGNPYPVFAICDDPVIPPYNNWQRIRVYRCSPQGTSFVGAGCTTTGVQPTIGIRRVDAQPTDHGRLLLGSAPPNALAVLVVAPATASLPAPVALDFLGLPGCDLLVTPAILEQRITGAAGMDRGYAAVDFPAAMAATGGVKFAAQWVVFDPVTGQHATTQRYEFRVQ